LEGAGGGSAQGFRGGLMVAQAVEFVIEVDDH